MTIWIGGGGPVLLVRTNSIASLGEIPSDGLLGCFSVGSGEALSLGDGVRTTWLPRPGGGILVRWPTGDDEVAALAAVDELAEATWMPTGCRLATRGGDHVLVDARHRAGPVLPMMLKTGAYDISRTVAEDVFVYRLTWRPSKIL